MEYLRIVVFEDGEARAQSAATATFAVTEAVMLRPLPVRNPVRLVAFTTILRNQLNNGFELVKIWASSLRS